MDLHCEHCLTPLHFPSPFFCQDCRVLFCSACFQDNHSTPGNDGSFGFHRISDWNEKDQKDAACLVVNYLNDHMDQIKNDGEVEIARCAQRIDCLKELLQSQMRLQLGKRISSLEESVDRLCQTFSISEDDCVDDDDDNSSSRPVRAAKAEFLRTKSEELGILSDVPHEADGTMIAIGEFLDVVDDVCAADDPFSRLPGTAVKNEDDNASVETLSNSNGTEDFGDGLQDDGSVAPFEQTSVVRHEASLSAGIADGCLLGKPAVWPSAAPRTSPTASNSSGYGSPAVIDSPDDPADPSIFLADPNIATGQATKSTDPHENDRCAETAERKVEDDDVVFVEEVIFERRHHRSMHSSNLNFPTESFQRSPTESNSRSAQPCVSAGTRTGLVTEQSAKAQDDCFSSIKDLLDMFANDEDDDDILCALTMN